MCDCPVSGLEMLLCYVAVYQTESCAVMDLAVGEDRCAIWPCKDKTLVVWECTRGDQLWRARQ